MSAETVAALCYDVGRIAAEVNALLQGERRSHAMMALALLLVNLLEAPTIPARPPEAESALQELKCLIAALAGIERSLLNNEATT
ncbi:MAG TPA: hypothetical protein VGY48_12585 [Vicinamibacterales bacterium]|jgi:hypothetical protein|nr:hypothetical protein [Vicinamibacterales bacterium]